MLFFYFEFVYLVKILQKIFDKKDFFFFLENYGEITHIWWTIAGYKEFKGGTTRFSDS